MKEHIHYPVAINQETNKPIHAAEIKVNTSYNCICFHCNENLTVINSSKNKQRPHFRHKPESNCTANFETFIHWLTKVVFKNIKTIKLPAVTTNEINITYSFIDVEIEKLYKKYKIPNELKCYFKGKKIIAASNIITIDGYSIEERFDTVLGKIRVDIVIKSGGNTLLIEPFYAHQIDRVKYSKLETKDLTTLAIDLNNFISKYDVLMTEKLLEDYIANDLGCKTWIYIKKEEYEIYQKKYVNLIELNIKNNLKKLEECKNILTQIEALDKSKDNLHEEMKKLRNRFSEVDTTMEGLKENINKSLINI